MMYLADAEINGGAFNFFFGSSVLEMAKFYVSVFVAGLDNPAALGPDLWGPAVPDVALSRRKWGDYIDAARHLTRHAPIMKAAKAQVAQRTAHFRRTLPPEAYVASNAAEWEDLHRRLNGGVPVPKKHQLPYFFDDAAAWCGDARE